MALCRLSACYICKSPTNIAGSGRNQYPQNDRKTTSNALIAEFARLNKSIPQTTPVYIIY